MGRSGKFDFLGGGISVDRVDNMGTKTCSECINWIHEQWVMNKYGEGCGICRADGQVRFCSHRCPFCHPEKEE